MGPNTLAERIEEVQKELNVSQSDIARAAHVKPSSVNNWLSGKTKSLKSDVAAYLCKTFGLSYDWLVQGKGTMRMLQDQVDANGVISVTPEVIVTQVEAEIAGQSRKPPPDSSSGNLGIIYPDPKPVLGLSDEDPRPDQTVSIRQFKIGFSAGNGAAPPTYEEEHDALPLIYRLEWFQKRQINPAACKSFKVDGTSMEPTLWNGDRILVDEGQREIISGKIYAFLYGDDLWVKRLVRLPDGTVHIISDNPKYPITTLSPGFEVFFWIIGRVVDRSGDSGL